MSPRCRQYRGLTLAEVLATVAIMAILLPVIMQAISVSTALASTTRLRSQATYLAEMKLDELIASGEWKTAALAGDFGAQWPGFHWESAVSDWDEADMRQLQVTVTYFARGQDREVALTTLVYDSSALTEETSSQ